MDKQERYQIKWKYEVLKSIVYALDDNNFFYWFNEAPTRIKVEFQQEADFAQSIERLSQEYLRRNEAGSNSRPELEIVADARRILYKKFEEVRLEYWAVKAEEKNVRNQQNQKIFRLKQLRDQLVPGANVNAWIATTVKELENIQVAYERQMHERISSFSLTWRDSTIHPSITNLATKKFLMEELKGRLSKIIAEIKLINLENETR